MAGAVVQAQQGVAAALGVVQRFQCRGGRAEQQRDVFQARTHGGQVAGVVAQAFLLFIGGVVFFVDDDQARVLQWGEKRRSCADNDVGGAIAGGQPGIQAFAIGQGRVQQDNARIEAAGEAFQGLRPQIDLRDQHQCLLAGLQGFADQLQVDLGLAAAGDSGQQGAVELAKASANGFESAPLLIVEWQFGLGQPGAMPLGRCLAALFDVDQAFVQQQLEAVAVELQALQQGLGHTMGVLAEGAQGFELTRGATQARIVQLRAGADMPDALDARLGRLALTQQGWQSPGEGVAEAVLVVLRGPQAELEQAGRQRRLAIQQLQSRAQFVSGYFGVRRQFDEDADDLAPAKRDAQAHAGLQGGRWYAGRRQVVEQPTQWRGQGKAQDHGWHGRLRTGRGC